ncbi:hypothetical protein FHS39_003884 [Streptomyces olivoverticillatus]|uniref:DUF916 domain-containing protein n=1 Tax=Streptomyces olivoverticillatus TaxID=66427 RepID=A0A7W7LSA0_9ACTN|nr:hypothetical protein [Streptomyces olivoverticillatus]MBB4894826.1 hypothetical protein [Streptomyces olivoverticillatus]
MPSRTPAALLAALALLAAPAVPAAASDAGAWTAAPAPGGGQGRPAAEDRSSFYLEGGPGTVFEDRLTLVNPGRGPLAVEVRGTGPWIALAARRLTVPPRTRADVPLTVTVPPGTSPGDHPAAVLATAGGRQVRVPMAVRVSGPLLAALAVEHVQVSGTGRGTVIRYDLVNRGNTTLAPRLMLRAEGLFGRVMRRTASCTPAALAPGRSVRLAEKWPDAPRLDRVTVSVTATARGAARATASGSYTPLPWLGPSLAAAGALAAGWGALRLTRRVRRRGRRPAAEAAA